MVQEFFVLFNTKESGFYLADPDGYVLCTKDLLLCEKYHIETHAQNILKLFQKPEEWIIKKATINIMPPKPTLRKKALSISEAINLPSVENKIDECEGKIAAVPTVNCPPAIPIVICGEIIDRNAIESFKYYGITSCLTVDEAYN